MSEASINIDADADKQALEIKTQVDRKIVAKLTDLKLKDISEADARADLRRDSLKTGYVDKSKEDDDDLKKLLLEQHINASKVLSIPGEHICDSPVETRFIRNNKGDVIAKEFYVKEFYLKDCLSMSQTIVEAHHCFKIKYSLNITGTWWIKIPASLLKSGTGSFSIIKWLIYFWEYCYWPLSSQYMHLNQSLATLESLEYS